MEGLKVCIVGSGIIGLSTAICLLERIPSVNITIIEKGEPFSTSHFAGAFYYPFFSSKVLLDYCSKTKAWFEGLCKRGLDFIIEGKGVVISQGYGKRETIEFDTFLVEPFEAMKWLRAEVLRKNVQIKQKVLDSERFYQLPSQYDFVINCSGGGSHALVPDKNVKLSEGTLLHYPKDVVISKIGEEFEKSLPIVIWDESGDPSRPTCIFRHSTFWKVGGTYFITDHGSEKQQASEEIIQDIKERVTSLWPGFEPLSTLGQPSKITTGYTPVRNPVFLERDHKYSNLIHNFGHGGLGWNLFYGNAGKVF
eukprot:TRINITY_DN737_c0_g1_i4.p1 TRINITY_DN737_c0_g1~~TRINITY_DN737_c0_g1_i4.p1  ORF type:complete len:308 (+),score=45.28 TRINITY_DN737_c0_g1_i4:1294-2217(+)